MIRFSKSISPNEFRYIHEHAAFVIENGDIASLSFLLQFFCKIDDYFLRADYVQDAIL